jgi:predicted nucleic acid-binding protein
MKRLYNKFFLVNLLWCLSCIHTMENTTDNVGLPNLQQLCLNYIADHIQEVDAINNLSKLPVDFAGKVVSNFWSSSAGTNKDLFISLINEKDGEKKLDHSILNELADKLLSYQYRIDEAITARLLDITNIINGLTQSNLDPALLAEFTNRINKIACTQKQEMLISKLKAFNELALTIHTNQLHKDDSELNEQLLKKLRTHESECIEECIALKKDSLTIDNRILAHTIAKNGSLSFSLTLCVCKDFISADIPQDFDTLFNHYFPEDVLLHGNDALFYNLISSSYPTTYNPQKNTIPFPAQEFEKQVSATLKLASSLPWIEVLYNTDKKHTRSISSLYLTELLKDDAYKVSAIINPHYNILLVHCKDENNADSIYLIDINTLTFLNIDCTIETNNTIKQLGLNADCTQLGIMFENGTTSSYELPSHLVAQCLSVKQKAFLFYIDSKMVDSTIAHVIHFAPLLNNMGNFSAIPENFPVLLLFFKEYASELLPCFNLINFVIKHRHLIPEFIHQSIYDKRIDSMQNLLALYGMFSIIATSLNTTVQKLTDKLLSQEISLNVFFETLGEIMRRMESQEITQADLTNSLLESLKK